MLRGGVLTLEGGGRLWILPRMHPAGCSNPSKSFIFGVGAQRGGGEGGLKIKAFKFIKHALIQSATASYRLVPDHKMWLSAYPSASA